MTTPSPFDIGRAIGGNVSGAFRGSQEQNSLEDILAQIQSGQAPQNIGAILQRFSPERQQVAQNALKSQAQQRAYQAQGLDPSIANLDPAIQKEIVKKREQAGGNRQAYDTSLNLIKRAKEIAGTGHLGPKVGIIGTGRKFGSTLSSEGQRLRAEYQQIGRALVQAAAPLKITNKAEFQHYAEGLEDPKRNLEDIMGSIDALERIIRSSVPGGEDSYINQKSQETMQTPKQASRPPLDSFYR